ncbi:hypothetical protein BH23CHL2_BH23CHL2_17460 [soil metagenome]
MPSDELDQTSPQADRLNRKIDRLQTGQPSPVHDGDTEELAELAQLLMDYLDKEQPDPAFREQLKQDLIAPSPRLVQLQPRSGPRRYPVPALFGALTVVLVASAVTGWMVFADSGGTNDGAMDRMARFASASPTAAAASGALSGALNLDATATRTRATGSISGDSSRPAAAAGESEAPAAATDEPRSTSKQAVIELPPVDANHVELGALATVSSPSSTEPRDVRFSQAIDPAAVDLDNEGVAYQFSSPYVDATLILRSVQEFLGIEAQIDQRERGGKTVYSLSSLEGSVNFTWSPESGAFSCTLPDPYSTADVEDLSEAAVQWLEEFGFPVSDSNIRPVIQTNSDGQTYVHVPLGDRQIPNPAIGHPMSITLVVDKEGRIVSVSGYWLEVTSQSTVPLVSAETAWQTVLSGGGYWPQGSASAKDGEFVAEHFEVSYMLTSAEQSKKGLTLQPVIAVSGLFHPDDGSEPFQTTVYVQGAPQL